MIYVVLSCSRHFGCTEKEQIILEHSVPEARWVKALPPRGPRRRTGPRPLRAAVAEAACPGTAGTLALRRALARENPLTAKEKEYFQLDCGFTRFN